MSYQHKTGRSGISEITISTWIKITQTAIDAALNEGLEQPWASPSVVNNIPICTIGTTKDQDTAGHTRHVGPIGIVAVIDASGDGEGGITLSARCDQPSWDGITVAGTPYFVSTNGSSTEAHPAVGLVVEGGISGTARAVDGFTGEILLTLSFDFSGITLNGHSPTDSDFDPTDPGKRGIIYEWDVTLSTDTIAVASSALFIDANDNTINFLVKEDVAAPRDGPTQGSYTIGESAPALVTDSWNHIFFTATFAASPPATFYMVVNNADTSEQTSAGGPLTWSTIGGEQLGFPITPQETDLHFSVGVNPNIRYAYTQVWLNKFIEPTAGNLAKVFTTRNGRLVPPTNKFAASDEFGAPDVYAYRDKNGHVFFHTGFTTVGATAADYFPGPGQ